MARIKPQALLIQSKKKKAPSRFSATTIILYTSVVALIVLLFTTYRHWSHRSRDQIGDAQSAFEDSNAFIDSKKDNIPSYAILNTSKGIVVVELFKGSSPEIVNKFIDLCQKGHFKGMSFNHVINNYVIHGGNSEGLGAAEDWTLKGKLHSQLATSPKHEAFMLGTSKSLETGKFEIYITTAPIPDLNDKLLVFGRVIKGEDVVQEIEEVDTDEHYRPKSSIGIINVTLKQDV